MIIFLLKKGDEQFIHFSTAVQCEKTAQKFFAGKSYVLLKVDTSKLAGKLVLEWNSAKTEKFWHIYEGHIPVDAVVEAQERKN